MNKIMFAAIGLLMLIISGCQSSPSRYSGDKIVLPSEMPPDFTFKIRFYPGGTTIDSASNTFALDMSCKQELPKIFMNYLDDNDKREVYRSIVDNDIFNIKGNFTEKCRYIAGVKTGCIEVMPSGGATIDLSVGGKVKKIEYSWAYVYSDDPELAKLKNLLAAVNGIRDKNDAKQNITLECGYD